MQCPRCGTGVMVKRTNSRTGDVFFGCSHFPECKQTLSDKPRKSDFGKDTRAQRVHPWKDED